MYTEYSANREEKSRKFQENTLTSFPEEKLEYDGKSATSQTEIRGFVLRPSKWSPHDVLIFRRETPKGGKLQPYVRNERGGLEPESILREFSFSCRGKPAAARAIATLRRCPATETVDIYGDSAQSTLVLNFICDCFRGGISRARTG